MHAVKVKCNACAFTLANCQCNFMQADCKMEKERHRQTASAFVLSHRLIIGPTYRAPQVLRVQLRNQDAARIIGRGSPSLVDTAPLEILSPSRERDGRAGRPSASPSSGSSSSASSATPATDVSPSFNTAYSSLPTARDKQYERLAAAALHTMLGHNSPPSQAVLTAAGVPAAHHEAFRAQGNVFTRMC